MLTENDLSNFLIAYEKNAGSPLKLVSFAGGQEAVCENADDERLVLLFAHLNYYSGLHRMDLRIEKHFPECLFGKMDFFPLSAVVLMFARDKRQALLSETGKDPRQTLLVITVSGWHYGGYFFPVPWVVAPIAQLPFKEVWVWTADPMGALPSDHLLCLCPNDDFRYPSKFFHSQG